MSTRTDGMKEPMHGQEVLKTREGGAGCGRIAMSLTAIFSPLEFSYSWWVNGTHGDVYLLGTTDEQTLARIKLVADKLLQTWAHGRMIGVEDARSHVLAALKGLK